MLDLWDKELSDEECEELIEKAAAEIERRKMVVPATLFIEMHRPLSYIGSQAAIVFSPFLVPFLGFDSVNNYSRLFAKRETADRLLRRLEEGKKPEQVPQS